MKNLLAIGVIWVGCAIAWMILGSTVVVCLERGRMQLDDRLAPGMTVRMGQRIGTVTPESAHA